ncbi:TIGR03085 family protein [Luteimicrobium album]|uniref:TIGR03085 family protein n=1 Tax=Luteimicrobium album TaxID=1054550 RepID=A0ABQ6I5Q8_9MICO|nr:TIGR03085 family metal-binding protein [Luteimicrobium album]GMA26113.1 TIGR03085 family protein [Luteimicrobium album]
MPDSGGPSRHARLRAGLAAALAAAAPDDPTLCEGWEARHLAAHVLTRQRSPRIHSPAFWALADRAQDPAVYADLVARVAAPPPRLSPSAWAGNLMNVTEFFVHAEDVRRGPRDVPSRALDDDVVASLWRQLGLAGRLSYRGAAPGVLLVAPGVGRRRVSRPHHGAGTVVVTGEVGELVLHASGRGRHAHVAVEGTDADVAALDAVQPGPPV